MTTENAGNAAIKRFKWEELSGSEDRHRPQPDFGTFMQSKGLLL